MRTKLMGLLIAVLSTLMIAGVQSPAQAQAPAPDCEAFPSVYYCFVTDPNAVSPITWSIKDSASSTTTTVVGGTVLRRGCPSHRTVSFEVTYSYVLNGTTIVSAVGGPVCDNGNN